MVNEILTISSFQDLQDIQEKFSKLLHLSIVVTDVFGQLHTMPSSPYCDIFRKSTDSIECRQCIWCAEAEQLLIRQNYMPQVSCPLGFEDFEIPINVNEQQIGLVIFGQVYKYQSSASTNIERLPEMKDIFNKIPVYSENDRTTLLAAVSSITQLITQVSFSRALEMENRKLDIVRDVMFQISKESKLSRIMDIIRRELPKIVKFDLIGIYFYDAQSKLLKRKFAEGFASEALGEDFKEGEGYAGTVAKEKKKYLIIDDARTSKVKIKYNALVERGLNSFLIAALAFDDEFIGVIILALKDKKGFREDVATHVAFVAENIAATIWKTRVNTLLGKKIDEMAAIIEFSTKPDIDSLLDFVVHKIPPLFNATACSVFLKKTDTNNFECKKTSGIYENISAREDISYPEDDKSLVGYVGKTGKYLILDDANSGNYLRERGLESQEKTDELTGIQLPALIVPIKDRDGNVKGVIRLLGKDDEGTFLEEDRQILETLAVWIELYLTNAYIKEDQNKLIHELKRLHEIQAELHSGLDEDKEIFHILTALTITGGFSFNRALLFLTGEENGVRIVRGRMAIGPSDKDNSLEIYSNDLWSDKSKTFSDFLRVAENEFDRNRGAILFSKLNRLTQDIIFNLDEKNILTDTINYGKNPSLFNRLTLYEDTFYDSLDKKDIASSEFILAPVVYHGDVLGAIYVDNKFTGLTIQKDQVYINTLNIFINQAAAVLHKALKLKVERSLFTGNIFHTLNTRLDQLLSHKQLMDSSKSNAEVFTRNSQEFEICMSELRQLYRELRDYNSFALNKVDGLLSLLLPTSDFYKKRGLRESLVSVKSKILNNHFICDFNALRSVIEELITNSCKHSGAGDNLRIKLNIDSLPYEELDMLIIEYSDNGRGILDELGERAFDIGVTTGREHGCTGIGMADIKQKIYGHGGLIQLTKTNNPAEPGVRILIQIPVLKGEDDNGSH